MLLVVYPSFRSTYLWQEVQTMVVLPRTLLTSLLLVSLSPVFPGADWPLSPDSLSLDASFKLTFLVAFLEGLLDEVF